jgi:hypothetical protein
MDHAVYDIFRALSCSFLIFNLSSFAIRFSFISPYHKGKCLKFSGSSTNYFFYGYANEKVKNVFGEQIREISKGRNHDLSVMEYKVLKEEADEK